jgi:hypothetical protein
MTSAPPRDAPARRPGSAALGTTLLGVAGWLALLNLRLPARDGWVFWVPIALWLVAMGLLCWWTALAPQRQATRARIEASWRLGWLVGAAGLLIGFVGPLVVMPRASLGPLLGILITGPVGFVLGALAGAVAPADRRAS